jgi:hypothetical protein
MRQILRPVEPSENFVPVLSLRQKLDYLARKHHWSLQHGADDLDEYDVVLIEYNGGRRFLLLKYAGSPDDMVDVYIPARMPNYRLFLKDIVDALRVPKSDVIDRNANYERF